MATTSEHPVLVCKRDFWVEIDGTPTFVRVGTTAREGHPIVEGREDCFEPVTVDYEHTSRTKRR